MPALLTLEDLPTGWTLSTEDGEEREEGPSTFLCQEYEPRSLFSVETAFEKSQLGPQLSETIVAYPPGEAAESFAEMIVAAESCPEMTQTLDDGSTMTFQISPLSFPSLGDKTLALRASTEDIPLLGLYELDAIYIRQDDIIINILYGVIGMEGIDSEQTERFAHLAFEKLDDVLSERQ